MRVGVSGDNLGRVTKGAAKAFLGRVLLFRASPQFNPSNNAEHWQTAYNYNKETLDYLIGQGHALYSDYGKLFLEEMNQEVIFAIRFTNRSSVSSCGTVISGTPP